MSFCNNNNGMQKEMNNFESTPTTSYFNGNYRNDESDPIPYIDEGIGTSNAQKDDKDVENFVEQFFVNDDHNRLNNEENSIVCHDQSDDATTGAGRVNNERFLENAAFSEWMSPMRTNELANNRSQEDEQQQEDVFGIVKCLYYSIQCCECTIV